MNAGAIIDIFLMMVLKVFPLHLKQKLHAGQTMMAQKRENNGIIKVSKQFLVNP